MFSETYFKFSKNMDIIGGSKWALCERSILDVAAASDPSLDILSKRSNSYSLTLFFYRYFYLRKIYGGLEDLKWNKLKEKQIEVSIKSTIKYFNLILQLSPSLQLVSLLPKEFICSEAYIAVLFGFYNKGNNLTKSLSSTPKYKNLFSNGGAVLSNWPLKKPFTRFMNVILLLLNF